MQKGGSSQNEKCLFPKKDQASNPDAQFPPTPEGKMGFPPWGRNLQEPHHDIPQKNDFPGIAGGNRC